MYPYLLNVQQRGKETVMAKHVNHVNENAFSEILDALFHLGYISEAVSNNSTFYYHRNGASQTSSYLIAKHGDAYTIETITSKQHARFMEIAKRANRFANKC